MLETADISIKQLDIADEVVRSEPWDDGTEMHELLGLGFNLCIMSCQPADALVSRPCLHGSHLLRLTRGSLADLFVPAETAGHCGRGGAV